MSAVLLARDLTKTYVDRQVLKGVSLTAPPGRRIGLVGENGVGKTTLLRLLAGLEQPDSGEVHRPEDVGFLPQEPSFSPRETLADVLDRALDEYRQADKQLRELSEVLAEHPDDAEALADYGRVLEWAEQHALWDVDHRADEVLAGLGLSEIQRSRPIGTLSGGQRSRLALALLLLRQPQVLLLDEPTNHLDAESVLWLEQHLQQYEGAVIAVTHDRYFLDHVAEWIAEVDRGHLYPYEGNYSTYLEKKRERLQVQGKKDAKLAKRLKDELEWVRSNPKAKLTKSKARLARYEEMAAEAEKTRKLDFEEIQIPAGPRLGDVVIEADSLEKGFDGRQLIEGLSFSLPRNGIVGVIGPNGVGKSTLFKTIVGLEELDGGELKIGDSVKISYVDQSRGGIDPDKSLWEVVSDGLDFIQVGAVEMPSRAYVSAFGFKGPDQQKKAGVLSGGERNRLNLALTLKQGGNLLLLDEPTNDLDVETLGSLENALLEVPGCAVVVSHDRWFLDRVATHILAWEGTDEDPAKWYWFEGNFEAYEQNKVERLGEDAARPHRVTHRRLTRG